MALELKIYESEVTIPRAIENIVQLKEELTPKLEYYNNLVVTEDGIKAAKNDKSNLNKLRKAIEERRIEAKKQVLSLYEPLEAQCKELVALIDAPIKAIDQQVKVFEGKDKDEKYAALESFFNNMPHEDFITITDVLNPKWANKTEKLDTLKADMMCSMQKISAEYEQLNKLYENFPHKLAILDHYKTDKDFSQTMVYAKKLEFTYEQEKRKEAEAAGQVENTQNAPEAATPVNDVITPDPEQTAVPVESEQAPKIIIGKFEVAGTAEQIKALGVFMKSNGIKFSIIKD
ncbi:MAG: DUF1351 domain-containing protein [Ruminococcus sp.]|nr:DUF1351 domain-containing protein [Ruminococcus sp.]